MAMANALSYFQSMGFWTNDLNRYRGNDVEDWSHGPSGGPVKQWLAGAVIPFMILIYAIVCLDRGYTTLLGNRGSATLYNTEGIALACSYIAIAAFLHFHYFWGLHDKLYRFGQTLKVVALIIFIPLFLYAVFNMVFGGWG